MNGLEILLKTNGQSFVYTIPFKDGEDYPMIIKAFINNTERALLDMLAVRTYEKRFDELNESEQLVVKKFLDKSLPNDEEN